MLAHLAAGRSNARIAHVLHISVRTVENHVSSLLRKLEASDRRELAALAGPQMSEVGGGELSGFRAGAAPSSVASRIGLRSSVPSQTTGW